jgi:hypothetical protein
VSAVLYELSIRAWFGGWNPTLMSPPGREVFAFSPIRGLTAGSFNVSHGIFTSNPAWLLMLTGLPIWYSRARGSFLRFALVVGPAIVIQSTFNDWSGGYAPSGRYAMQFVPAFAPAIAMVLARASRPLRIIAVASSECSGRSQRSSGCGRRGPWQGQRTRCSRASSHTSGSTSTGLPRRSAQARTSSGVARSSACG